MSFVLRIYAFRCHIKNGFCIFFYQSDFKKIVIFVFILSFTYFCLKANRTVLRKCSDSVHGCQRLPGHIEWGAFPRACPVQGHPQVLPQRQPQDVTHLADGNHLDSLVWETQRCCQLQLRRLAILECALLGWEGGRALDPADHQCWKQTCEPTRWANSLYYPILVK